MLTRNHVLRLKTTRNNICMWMPRMQSKDRIADVSCNGFCWYTLICRLMMVDLEACCLLASFGAWQDTKKGHAAELLHHLPPGAKWDTAVKVANAEYCWVKSWVCSAEGLTKKMYRNIDKSFEEYLEKKNLGVAPEAQLKSRSQHEILIASITWFICPNTWALPGGDWETLGMESIAMCQYSFILFFIMWQ